MEEYQAEDGAHAPEEDVGAPSSYDDDNDAAHEGVEQGYAEEQYDPRQQYAAQQTNFSNVDLSASSYSLKKSAELKSMFSTRQRHVSEIISTLNERGIGRVSLKNVQVEAFIHPRVRDMNDGREEFDEMLAAALEERGDGENLGSVAQDGEEGGSNGEAIEIVDSGYADVKLHHVSPGEGVDHSEGGVTQGQHDFHQAAARMQQAAGGGASQLQVNETYLQQQYQSARGLSGDGSSRKSSSREISMQQGGNDVVKADVYETVHSSSQSSKSIRGSEQANRTVITKKNANVTDMYGNASESNAGTKQRSGANNSATKSTTYQSNTTSRGNYRTEVEVDQQHTQAYKMNASKPAAFRKLGEGGGIGLTAEMTGPTYQRDLDDVVAEMAENQNGMVQPHGTGEEMYIPEKSGAESDYEMKLKEQLNQTKKENAGKANVPLPPSKGLGRFEQKMKSKLNKKGGSSSLDDSAHSGSARSRKKRGVATQVASSSPRGEYDENQGTVVSDSNENASDIISRMGGKASGSNFAQDPSSPPPQPRGGVASATESSSSGATSGLANEMAVDDGSKNDAGNEQEGAVEATNKGDGNDGNVVEEEGTDKSDDVTKNDEEKDVVEDAKEVVDEEAAAEEKGGNDLEDENARSNEGVIDGTDKGNEELDEVDGKELNDKANEEERNGAVDNEKEQPTDSKSKNVEADTETKKKKKTAEEKGGVKETKSPVGSSSFDPAELQVDAANKKGCCTGCVIS